MCKPQHMGQEGVEFWLSEYRFQDVAIHVKHAGDGGLCWVGDVWAMGVGVGICRLLCFLPVECKQQLACLL